ncbi:hypothetical protein J1N51_03485 [Psychrosphaera ytuae]|uniref:Uncharacterized protein n=1 Tax=Psychrosphaera ytuae TaxID=2820710 RepID=A0A975DCC6_9GAMM|nr:hypothetical protein J1N51_03485 [Psychrosphaera ytuae]
MHKQFKDFVKVIRSKLPSIQISVSSNGTIYKRKLSSFMLDSIQSINISVDGLQKEHEIYRGSV